MKSILVTSSLIASIAFLFAIGSTPLVFASTSNASYATASFATSHVFSPALTKVPVSVTFSPKSYNGAPGSTVTARYSVKDTGTKSYTFTGCRVTEDGTNIGCKLSGPLKIKAGQTLTGGMLTIAIGTGVSAGKYTFKFSYTNSADISGMGTFTITVT